MQRRQFRLPIEPGNYTRLEALFGAIAYVQAPVEGTARLQLAKSRAAKERSAQV